MKSYQLIGLFLFLFSFSTYGSDRKLDSLLKAGNVNLYNGNYNEAIRDFEERKYRSVELGDSTSLAESLTYLGEVCRASRQFDLGFSFLHQALEISTQIRDSFYIAKSLNRMAAIKYEQRDTGAALSYAKQSLTILSRLHDANLSANNLNIIGAIFTSAGQYRQAITYYDQARKLMLTLSDQSDLPNVLNNIANNYFLLGEFQMALPYALESFQLASKENTLVYTLEACRQLTRAYKSLGNYAMALEYSEKAAAINEQYITELQKAGQSVNELKRANDSTSRQNAYLRQVNDERTHLLNVQSTLNSIVIAGLILMTVFLGLLLMLYRQRKKNLLILRDQHALLANQKQELQKLNQLKDTLLSVIAHDFRGPLVTLHSMLQLFEMGVQSREDWRKAEKKVGRYLQDTIETLDSVIFWSRTQMNGFTLNKEPFGLKKFSDEIADTFLPELEAKNLSFRNNIQESDTIVSDRDVLKIVLRNLLSNAIKFSYPDGSIILFEKNEEDHIT
ncbi:MAG: tetratricopeptide repeat protein, partial [Chitinophagales bacterium]